MKIIFFILSFLFCTYLMAQDYSIVAVGNATLDREVLFFTTSFNKSSFSKEQQGVISDVINLVKSDFSFYKKRFELKDKIDNSQFNTNTPDYSNLVGQNVAYVYQLAFFFNAGQPFLTAKLYHVREQKELISRTQVLGVKIEEQKIHELNDEFYQGITGQKSIFNSKILFVSDKGSTRRVQIKELYLMDFDGKNIKKLTSHRGVVISPSISADNKRVLYSLILNTKSKDRNNNLYMLDLDTDKTTLISSQKGINSGAVFMQNGEDIALTLSHTGDAEIYSMNLESKKLRRITQHFADDVDPSISVDGTLMTFLSDRPGKAMIYTLDPRGKEKDVTRISFVGQFNATPRFSPDGKEIAFSSWLDNRFDIFRINSNGSGLSRLTKNFGSNEDPTYSNDGQFIAFSSQRVISSKEAIQNIYIMDREGDIVSQITGNFGNCITPRWSN